MHDFVSYLFYLLQRGMRFAVPAALVCGLILAVCYTVCCRQGRRFPWGKAVCALLLVGWAAVTVFVTLLRSEPNEFAARQCNLQLFLAWREAYQRFTLQIWLNVLLNIALFVPLGVLLPKTMVVSFIVCRVPTTKVGSTVTGYARSSASSHSRSGVTVYRYPPASSVSVTVTASLYSSFASHM